MALNSPEPRKTSEALVEITLEMIDDRGGLYGLNLREIAREAGCAHTNVYNYFDSFDGLVLAALKALLNRLISFTQEKIEPGRVEEEAYLEVFLAAQIDFALAHPGWYHFMWFDKSADVEADPELLRIFEFLASAFNEKVYFHYGRAMEKGKADEIGDMLHGLLHGEICKLISGRGIKISKAEYRERILADCRALLAAFAPDGKGAAK